MADHVASWVSSRCRRRTALDALLACQPRRVLEHVLFQANSQAPLALEQQITEARQQLGLCPQSSGMGHVRLFLAECRLEEYDEVMDMQGYDDIEYIFTMNHEQFEEMRRLTGMKPGHLAKLKHRVQQRHEDLKTRNDLESLLAGISGEGPSDYSGLEHASPGHVALVGPSSAPRPARGGRICGGRVPGSRRPAGRPSPVIPDGAPEPAAAPFVPDDLAAGDKLRSESDEEDDRMPSWWSPQSAVKFAEVLFLLNENPQTFPDKVFSSLPMERAFPTVTKPQRLRAVGFIRSVACKKNEGEVALHYKKLSKRQATVTHVPLDDEGGRPKRRCARHLYVISLPIRLLATPEACNLSLRVCCIIADEKL